MCARRTQNSSRSSICPRSLVKTDRNHGTDVLVKKIATILDAHGWKKCKTVYSDYGLPTDTYSKDRRLLEFSRTCSPALGCTVGITVAEKEMKPDPVPPDVPVSITSEWLTYRDASLGFEISFPPDWSVVRVESGYGVINSVGNCNKENCLMMRLGTDEEFAGDGFEIVISPEEIYSGEPCKPGPTCCGTTRISPSGQKYSSCTATTGPGKLPSTDYAIGPYATFAEQGNDSTISDICRRTLKLWTTVGDYRYAFTTDEQALLPRSFEMRDVFRKILSTVKVTPVRIGAGGDQPRQPGAVTWRR